MAPAEIVTVAGTVTRLGSLDVTLTTRSLGNAAGMVMVPLTTPCPTVALAGIVGVSRGIKTLKVLLLPTSPEPSVADRYMAVAVCWTVTLPVHTPFTKVAVVGATGTAEPQLGLVEIGRHLAIGRKHHVVGQGRRGPPPASPR